MTMTTKAFSLEKLVCCFTIKLKILFLMRVRNNWQCFSLYFLHKSQRPMNLAEWKRFGFLCDSILVRRCLFVLLMIHFRFFPRHLFVFVFNCVACMHRKIALTHSQIFRHCFLQKMKTFEWFTGNYLFAWLFCFSVSFPFDAELFYMVAVELPKFFFSIWAFFVCFFSMVCWTKLWNCFSEKCD